MLSFSSVPSKVNSSLEKAEVNLGPRLDTMDLLSPGFTKTLFDLI